MHKHEGNGKQIILSIPKSGTFLLCSILDKLGLKWPCYHIEEDGFFDFNNATVDEAKSAPEKFYKYIPINISNTLIFDGQFVTSHMRHSDETESALKTFNKIFLYRDIRDTLLSLMRWFLVTGRGGDHTKRLTMISDQIDQFYKFIEIFGYDHIQNAFNMKPWFLNKKNFKICYEELIGDFGYCTQRTKLLELVQFLGLQTTEQKIDDIILSVIGVSNTSLTFSGNRSNSTKLFLNEKIDQVFKTIGGEEVLKIYGYQ